ncbi:MAG: flagellar hook-associated protein FlgK [Planctomycetaceae bacterium]|nr:flagellar hook-associated protein FlgK [Planctomycetaceae bacterium]
MYLYDSLHLASNSLNAASLGMQVAGQNLANAHVPGYVRETLHLQTQTSRKLGSGIVVGNGVSVAGVEQVIDKFLEERLRTSTSDAMSSATQEQYYTYLEALLNETTAGDLSSSIKDFFNSIDNINNQPENVTYREMAAEQGKKLTEDINRLALAVMDMQVDVNKTMRSAADEINKLLTTINTLNKQITAVESNGQQALGLRDQRLVALSELSQYINIKTNENPDNGQITIYCGSDILLSDGVQNNVVVGTKTGTGNIPQAILCIRDVKSPLDVRSGSVFGLYEAHETILGGYLKNLDDFTSRLITKFNQVYSSGQGLSGYSHILSPVQINNPDEPLNPADLEQKIQNGSFIVQHYDTRTGITTQTEIPIRVAEQVASNPFSLKPAPEPVGTSLDDVAAAINAIENLSARVNLHGQLEITSQQPNIQFAFADDSSGFLSAFGLNTFFTGTSAATVGVNQIVLNDGSKFAASSNGVGNDNDNSVTLAAIGIEPDAMFNGKSAADFYNGVVGSVMLSGNTVKSIAASDTLYQQSLQTQRDSISGVNIDEETIMMMMYQRTYQANSRFIAMINTMLETLISL